MAHPFRLLSSAGDPAILRSVPVLSLVPPQRGRGGSREEEGVEREAMVAVRGVVVVL